MNYWDAYVATALSRPDVAGMLGSLTGAFVGSVPGATRAQRFINMCGGMVIAYYMGPVVADTLNITNPRGQTGVGFLAGMLGLAVLNQIAASIKSVDWKARIENFLDRFTGAKKS